MSHLFNHAISSTSKLRYLLQIRCAAVIILKSNLQVDYVKHVSGFMQVLVKNHTSTHFCNNFDCGSQTPVHPRIELDHSRHSLTRKVYKYFTAGFIFCAQNMLKNLSSTVIIVVIVNSAPSLNNKQKYSTNLSTDC